MGKFRYTAINKQGDEVSGLLDSESVNDALNKIRQMDLFPVDVLPAKDIKSGVNILSFVFGKVAKFRSGPKDIKQESLVIFTRQLSVLLDAGLTLVRALGTLKKQTRFVSMGRIISDIIDMIESGKTFSDSLAHFPGSFTKIYVNIVKAGETGGALDEVLRRLADFLERNLKLNQKVKAALIYPVIVLLISLSILGFILTFVIPRFVSLFEDLGTQLPAFTLAILNLSNFVCRSWYIILGVIAVLIFSYHMLLYNRKFRYFKDKLSLSLPIIGVLIQKITTSRFARTLATLITGGVPILRALELTKDVSGNEVVGEVIDTVYDAVREGGFISRVLANSKVFPELMVDMIAVGEESGSLDKMLAKVADTYEEDVELTTGMLTSLLEPALIIVMGLVVGIIVLAMFLPLISLINALSN
ncbi:MAG: type II secretion system F family protein [Candidatus Omnitrophica bacterium]|nr:type II secretion system F family protein [Candidatus Omnitrophota bacterium]MBU1926064.1 type II secretion system F family protein [Candidatus Omnitrophota bacterium]